MTYQVVVAASTVTNAFVVSSILVITVEIAIRIRDRFLA